MLLDVDHFKAVNDAIGIPIMLYNYPGRTGVDMAPEFIERLAELKNLRYVKDWEKAIAELVREQLLALTGRLRERRLRRDDGELQR